MLCNQCQQTPTGGCTVRGVCGKDAELNGVQELILYGLKGVSAYATEARTMGYTDEQVDATVQEALYTTLTNVNFSIDDHLDVALDVGEAAIRVMELLDEAHLDELGVPEPVDVPQNHVEGQSILVTGHDLHALKRLLEQSEGEGVNVYTHSEMLPAHGYPELAAYDHLKGNVGGAWHDQRVLLDEFPGVFLGTSNCVQPTRDSYHDRVFTTNVAGLDDVPTVEDDFTPVIEKAKQTDPADWHSDQRLSTGFHHETVLELAPEIIDAVEDGSLRRFFVIAGCDGPTPGRDYFRELAASVPEDCVIMTTSCGKFRFNDMAFGTVPGTDIPRYIDLGQCSNSISTVKIATALADAFDCGVNDLPLSIALSWFEQKAVAILLGLFSLGVEDIYLGPTMPEFLTPDVADVISSEFGLRPTGDPQMDLERMLAN